MDELITQATNSLKSGEVVSLPTETVYSLSVNASDELAVEKIYLLKGRKKDNPLALLVGSVEQAKNIVQFNENAEKLAEEFFPGPLTIILQKKNNSGISDVVNDGLSTLAVRMPKNDITLNILNSVKFPIVGTSANPSGMPPAASADEVKGYFEDKVGLIIDDGISDIGVASTIVDLSGGQPELLRQGFVSQAQIEDVLEAPLLVR